MNQFTPNNITAKYGEELSAAVALTTLGEGPSSSNGFGNHARDRTQHALQHNSRTVPSDLMRLLGPMNYDGHGASNMLSFPQRTVATPYARGAPADHLLSMFPQVAPIDVASRSMNFAVPEQREGPEFANSSEKKTSPTPKSKKKRNFTLKLFDVLDSGRHTDIVAWLPGGKAFIVLDKKRFAIEILPHYFKESQYTSFTRKLSRWKFTRVSRGPYMGAYFHKNFRSDNRMLCARMSCNNSSGSDENGKATKKNEEIHSDCDDRKKEGIVESPTQSVPKRSLKQDTSIPIEESSPKPHYQAPSVLAVAEEPFIAPSNFNSNGNNYLNATLTTQNEIQSIKQQLMEIRLRKAAVEEQKQFLVMQAEAERLKEIHRIKAMMNLSIQEAESRIISAANHSLFMSQNQGNNMNFLPSPFTWQQNFQFGQMPLMRQSQQNRAFLQDPEIASEGGISAAQSSTTTINKAFAA